MSINTQEDPEIQPRLMDWLGGAGATERRGSPADFDPAGAQRIVAAVGRLFGPRRWFRLSVDGWERLPPPPVLLVGNHSGGTTVPDAWGLAVAWYRHFGSDRPVHALAHDLVFGTAATARAFGRIGVVRAGRAMATDVLTTWQRDLLVLPGGERDTWRPWTQRDRVCFAGRKGYARLAVATGVPVVPVAHEGAHRSLVVLSDGRRLARALGLPRLARAEIFPLHLSLPWGLALGPLPHLPAPVHLRYRFGQPVLPDKDLPVDLAVERLDRQVRAELQDRLDELAALRRPTGALSGTPG